MSFQQTFRINAPAVVSEAFEHEVVIIHLESGAYYSLTHSGAEIWQLLQQGVSVPEINSRLATAYARSLDEIVPPIEHFITELAQEQLITPTMPPGLPSNGAGHPLMAGLQQPAHAHFPPPLLHKFTDMQDLLLLDPIHDVDETGWPTRKVV